MNIISLRDLNINCGYHYPIKKTLEETLTSFLEGVKYENVVIEGKKRDIFIAPNCIQFFLGNYISVNRKKISFDDLLASKKLISRYNFYVFSHAPYVYNLCGNIKSLAWEKDLEVDNKLRKIISSLEYELSILSNFKYNGVVIHPGSFPNKTKGIQKIIQTINMINFPDNSKLILENTAGEGNKIPKDLDDIKAIIEGINPKNRKHIGVCIDTAHIHGSGIYDLSLRDDVDDLFDDFKEKIGLEYFSLLHLNDSAVELGSKKDRHESLSIGKIWKDAEDMEILTYLLSKCKMYNIPIILETPDPILDIKSIYNITKEPPLEVVNGERVIDYKLFCPFHFSDVADCRCECPECKKDNCLCYRGDHPASGYYLNNLCQPVKCESDSEDGSGNNESDNSDNE